MHNKFISVIMSTYNETEENLLESINSILSQTYREFEFIIINDNPQNATIKRVLDSLSDSRIVIVPNKKNYGLVHSLNYALEIARGDIIARMDADDISYPTRFKTQLTYLLNGDYDLVGSYIQPVNEKGHVIKDRMKFPLNSAEIQFFMQWGNCVAHPTWMGKRDMFIQLQGYRNISYCEDYDFLLRAIKCGYKIGNLPQIELKYRVREQSISISNNVDQYLLRNYLSKNRQKILQISDSDIKDYLISKKFEYDKRKYLEYLKLKITIKNSGNDFQKRITSAIRVISNSYLYVDLIEKLMLILRER